MNKYGKKLLSALLVVAMMASLLIVPAAAAEGVAVGTSWIFKSDKDDPVADADWTDADYGYGNNTTDAGMDFKGLTLAKGSGYHGGYLYPAGGVSLVVAGSCNVEVTCETGYANGTVGIGTDTVALKDGTAIYSHPEDTSATITIKQSGFTCIKKIKVTECAATPVLDLPVKGVAVKASAADGVSFTPDITNVTNPVVAFTGDTTVATAEFTDGDIVVKPVDVGNTTFTVTVTGDNVAQGDALTGTFAVYVWDDSEEVTQWDFADNFYQKTETTEFKGLVISSGASANGTTYGAKVQNGTSIQIPVKGDSTITVTTNYAWGFSMEGVDSPDNATGNPKTNDYVQVVFNYTGEAGFAVLKTTTYSQLKAIKVEADSPVDPPEETPCTKTEGCTLPDGHEGDCVVEGGGEEPEPSDEPTYVAAGTYNFQDTSLTTDSQDSATVAITGVTLVNGFTRQTGNSHGVLTQSDSTMTLNLEKKATVTITGCGFMTALNVTAATDKNGNVTIPEPAVIQTDGNRDTNQFVFENVEGAFALVFGANSYIHNMVVEYAAAPAPVVPSADKRIGVWDIAGKAEADTSLYTNHITPATWAAYAATQSGTAAEYLAKGEFPGQTVTLDGLTITAATPSSQQCSLFSTVTGAWGGITPKTGSLVTTFEDGYTSAGGYMAYGAGTNSRRYITIAGVKAGDTVVAYLGNNQKDTTYVVDGVEATLTLAKNEYGILTFIAPKAGSYKIYEAANAGKPAYLRVMVVPPVTVSGSITLPSGFDATGWGLKFVDPETKATTEATVNNDGTYTVELAPDHTYNASLTGANGWGMTVATKQVAPVKTDITTGKDHDLVVEAKSQYTYSGTVTGFAAGYDTSKLVITLIPDEDSKANAGAEDVDLTLSGMDFTAVLDPSVVYTLELKGVNDYAIKAPAEVTSEGENLAAQSIVVEPKALVTASGKFVVLDVDDQFAPLKADSAYAPLTDQVTKLVFENVDDGYTYAATVADGGYTADLRAGAYLAKATVNGYATKTHVVVADKAVSKDLLFVSTATPAAVDYAADIYVGDATKSPNFKTVTGAMAYIKRMTRTDAQRVTVHIAPGTYREQISIDSKNVTFVNDTPGKEAKLTWYYAIGYTYYSATGVSSTDSWYDAQLAFDKYAQPSGSVARWGATVRVQAPGFQAENITFENSFNYYLTDEEVLDGVKSNGETLKVEREYGVDVTAKTYTERAAALWVDTNSGRGDMTEFKSCKFLSSQDTLGTGNRMYFKDCYIEGMTDYICGPGDVVFDTCTLNWKGYSDTATGGYLTAPQTGASEKGYFFRNCYVSGDTKLKLTGGALGRTWGAANTKCLYLNTTLQSADLINNATWVEMQGFNPANSSTLLEWGTMLADGTAVDLSKRTLQNTVAKTQPTAKPTDFFAGWEPEYYVEEAQGVALAAAPLVSDNGDINLPHPGHTLTVAYTLTPEANNANDASTIQWYRVKDGVETLVKTSTAVAGKTYQIQEADVGAHIKVTVTPKTLGGQTGDALSYTVAEVVQEGYDDPSQVVDPVLGAGVNVYLAGDSTVKDYSAAGMWNGGKLQGEGSWGEWIQRFFNDKVTVVNYAQGGRTTRSFIEQDKSLEKIDATIKEGDFLFIQFGHNDSHTADDRGVPLGIAKGDAQKTYAEGGVYPDTSLEANTYYPAGTKTYTAYLKDYIAVTEAHGATAVLMTPVSRLYYTNDGKIRPHHDATAFDGTEDNEYCKAVKWVYDWAVDQGYKVEFIDTYQLTADLFEMAYADGGDQTYGRQLMASGESTHNSKLGGLIEAAVVAQAIQNSGMTIAKAVQAPAQVQGKTPEGETAFTVSGSGTFAAYDNLTGFAEHATYWEGKGQKMFDDIAAKAKELNGTKPDDPNKPDDPTTPDDPTKPADKTALTQAIADAKAAIPAGIYTVGDDTKVTDVNRGTKFITQSDKAACQAAIDKAVAAAEAVLAKTDATQAEVDAAVKALTDAVTAAKAAIKTGTKSTGGSSVGGGTSRPSGSSVSGTVTVSNANGDKVQTVTSGNGDKTITVTGKDGEVLAEVKLPATIPATTTKFVDVPDDHWAAQAINTMAALGMVKGVSEDTYDMVSPMTRGSIATILYRLSNGVAGKTTAFADVAENAWYADAVGWAAATGVVNGYSDTAFGPDDTITRQQLAVMLARYAKLLGLDTTAEVTALDSFADGSTVGDWATGDMAWCVQKGILKGRGNGVLDPTADVTRAEAAVMLDRMLDLIK